MRHRHLSLSVVVLLLLSSAASAMILVGKGNKPVDDQNWPAGTLEVANLKTRIGWWEGPPFGGGEWHFIYQGDAAALQQAIDLFAKIQSPARLIVVHEGPHVEEILDKAKADWRFTAWNPRSWNHLYNNPKSVVMSDDPSGRFRQPVDPPRIDVYVAPAGGEGIRWEDIKVPAGVTVKDERATAAGYDANAGSVVRGVAYDMITSKPIGGATIVVAKSTGQNAWEMVATADTDAAGKFEITKVPAGTFRVTASRDGYVSRMLGYATMGANTLQGYTAQLAPPANAAGVVRDTAEKPLSNVKVRAANVLGADGRGYLLADEPSAVTDEQGRFHLTLPAGTVRLSADDGSHQMLDVLQTYSVPADDITLRMTATGTVKGRVLKPDGTPAAGGDVSVNPPGKLEDRVGKWGGGQQVNPDGTFQFDHVPPGRYLVSTDPGKAVLGNDPNAKEIEVKAGETLELQLTEAAR